MTATIRPARLVDAPAIAQVHVASWRTSYRSILPEEVLAQLSVDRRTRMWEQVLRGEAGRQHLFVAEDESGRVVGFAAGGPERSEDPTYTGELYAIYLLESHQRRGIGRGLTRAVVDRLVADGHRSMLVWVLAENPSRAFYEALGAHYVRSQTIAIGRVQKEEAAYGWTDLRSLAESLAGAGGTA